MKVTNGKTPYEFYNIFKLFKSFRSLKLTNSISCATVTNCFMVM